MASSSHIQDSLAQNSSKRKRAPAISQARWKEHRSQITELYGKYDLDKVMAVMARAGFKAQKCQYKTQFKLWRLRKNERRTTTESDNDEDDIDQELPDEERAQCWARDGAYVDAFSALDQWESLERVIICSIGAQTLREKNDDLLAYLREINPTTRQSPDLRLSPSSVQEDDLYCLIRYCHLQIYGLIVVFYCFRQISSLLQTQYFKPHAYTICSYASNASCGISNSECKYGHICRTMFEHSAAAPKFVLAKILARRILSRNESTRAIDQFFLDQSLEECKRDWPSVYQYAYAWSGRVTEKMVEDLAGRYKNEWKWRNDILSIIWDLSQRCSIVINSD